MISGTCIHLLWIHCGKTIYLSVCLSVCISEDLAFQLGLLSGICPFDGGFTLHEFSATLSMKERVHEYGSPKRLSQLVAQLPVTEGYRENARKVAVIFLGGKMDTQALLDAVC